MSTRIAAACAVGGAAFALALAVPATASAATPQIQPTKAASSVGPIGISFCINIPLGSSNWSACLP